MVISLIMVMLITILALGFVSTVRLDRSSARLHLNGIQADVLCQSAEEIALSRLVAVTAQPFQEYPVAATTTKGWISEPGRLVIPPTAAGGSPTVVDLSSGESNQTDDNLSVNLNPPLLSDSTLAQILPPPSASQAPRELRVQWIYTRKDGTLDPASLTADSSAIPAYSATNPITGRFAFWVDDDSTKLNLNTAWIKDAAVNKGNASSPSRVDLVAALSPDLVSGDVDSIHARRLTRPFNSTDEAKAVSANVKSLVDRKKFSVSYYNHSPDLNMFGEPRIMLTTQKSLAGDSPYFDILSDGKENTDPGDTLPATTNLNATKISALVSKISSYLSRTDWPIKPGTSFADKYAPKDYPGHVDQMALDIIDYVRSRESTLESLNGLTGVWINADNNKRFKTFQSSLSSTTACNYLGNTRRPYMTEIGVWLRSGPVKTDTTMDGTIVKVEFWLPPGCAPVDMTKLDFWMAVGYNPDLVYQANVAMNYTGGFGGTAVKIKPGPPPPNNAVHNLQAYLDSAEPLIQPGQYRVVTGFQNQGGRGSASQVLTVRVRACGGASTAMNTTYANINYKPDPVLDPLTGGTRTPDQVSSVKVADPLGAKQNMAWGTPEKGLAVRHAGVKQGANNFGQANDDDMYVPNSPEDSALALPADPPVDRAANGNTYKNGARFFPQKGYMYPDGSIEPGMVASVAELGFVHTGNSMSFNGGIPWRTYHLQPQPATSSGDPEFLPDWALLDLFSAPVDATAVDKPVLRPGNRNMGGKLNLNSMIYPFQSPVLTRDELLPAAVRNISKDLTGNKLSSSEVSKLIDNITHHTLSPKNTTTSLQGLPYLDSTLYYSPWQLAEVEGLADAGEESETVLREVASLVEARGSVFSIYSVGQSVIQEKTGKITVLGEQRNQKIVERMARKVQTPATGPATKIVVNSYYQTVFDKKRLP